MTSRIMRRTAVSRTLSAASAVAMLGALAACGGGSTPADTATATTTVASSPADASPAAEGAVTLDDGWVRSKEQMNPTMAATATVMASDMTMTGVFGTLKNNTDQEITITGGTSPAAGIVEVHETVNVDGVMKMQAKEGGFVLPAKGTLKLEPGSNHIMLMEMAAMPKMGTTVDLTLATSQGDVKLAPIPVRNFDGGDEEYVPAK